MEFKAYYQTTRYSDGVLEYENYYSNLKRRKKAAMNYFIDIVIDDYTIK